MREKPMEHPLSSVYFTERCNACGGTYPVTLYGIYLRQHLDEQWQSARSCDTCSVRQERLVAAVPAQELADLVHAWENLAAALQARGLTYAVGMPPG
jgi:hypothetical protein